jgi:beta-galactosidase
MCRFRPALVLAVLASLLPSVPALASGPVDVRAVSVARGAVPLDGPWQFRYVASSDVGADEGFYRPDFDTRAWKTLPVPSHWELHGYAAPKYKSVEEGTGLYRRTFRAPKAWRGQRVFVRFEGVQYGMTVWVNGTNVGEWASSYNPATFDVTDALRQDGSENVIAVRVTTRSKGWEFDTNDCWALSGIYREVTLFAVPATHLTDVTTRTTLRPDGDADVCVDVAASAPSRVVGRLRSPTGAAVGEFSAAIGADGRASACVVVDAPHLWTAETPALYRLDLTLRAGGRVVQHDSERIGIRQVTIENGILKLNGVPIKLRGVNHHDIWPDSGRTASDAQMRRDLEMMRDANINFIRTSHYPPHPRLVELADELGFYVMDEVPFGFGDKHLTDPTYRPVLLARARATVMRDKNRPSVIIWSIGNENPVAPLQLDTAREVKRLDPTRPICIPTVGSYFAQNWEQFPDFVDIYAPHYPSNDRLREYAERLKRPIIVTEYAHQLGLASDRVQDQWDYMFQTPQYAGGAIWMFQDQGLLRTATAPIDAAAPTKYVWTDALHYFDTAGTDGADGIVYSDRTPQTDYWQTRKVYAPVQIKERALAAGPGRQTLTLHVENRRDFTPLTDVSLRWLLRRNGVPLQQGTTRLRARPRDTEAVALDVTLPDGRDADVFSLEILCVDASGRTFHERTLPVELGERPDRRTVLLAGLTSADPALAVTDTSIRVSHPRGELRVDRLTGATTLVDAAGATVVAAIGPHTGRPLTMAEDLRAVNTSIWRGELLEAPERVETAARAVADGVQVAVRGRFTRPGSPDQALDGECRFLVLRSGAIDVSYDYTLSKADGKLLEAGLALRLPPDQTEFRWLGQGPFAGYPGKDRLNEYGTFHLTRQDLRFQGNRRGVEFALVSSPSGDGVLLAGAQMDTAVAEGPRGLVVSHNALVSGLGNKGSAPESDVTAADGKRISGAFTLLPVAATWPESLVRWFGKPGPAAAPEKPYYRSYDRQ